MNEDIEGQAGWAAAKYVEKPYTGLGEGVSIFL
jgi:hypothetical protein